MLATILYKLDRLDGGDSYAGSVSRGGSIDATAPMRPSSRSPGRLGRTPTWHYSRRFEASSDPVEQVRIVREAGDELARRVGGGTFTPPGDAYKVKAPGRPRSKASGRVLARASEASGESVETLRSSVARGRKPHPALVNVTLAELDAGTSLAAAARELGTCERTIRRWRSVAE